MRSVEALGDCVKAFAGRAPLARGPLTGLVILKDLLDSMNQDIETKSGEISSVGKVCEPDNPLRRKILMAATGGVIGAVASTLAGTREAMAATPSDRKVLIVYFSRTGNTRDLANQIQQRVGGDLFELRTVHSYPKEYRATTDQTKREQEANFRPQLAAEPQNLGAYDTVFVGYPNWWGTLPMAFFSFFEKYNFTGKTLIPFSTHEGSHLGGSVADMRRLCPNARILEGIALRGGVNSTVKSDASRREVAEWLTRLGMVP